MIFIVCGGKHSKPAGTGGNTFARIKMATSPRLGAGKGHPAKSANLLGRPEIGCCQPGDQTGYYTGLKRWGPVNLRGRLAWSAIGEEIGDDKKISNKVGDARGASPVASLVSLCALSCGAKNWSRLHFVATVATLRSRCAAKWHLGSGAMNRRGKVVWQGV